MDREVMFVASDDSMVSARKPSRERHNVCLELCQEVRDELRPIARLMAVRTWHVMGNHHTNDDTKIVTPPISFEYSDRRRRKTLYYVCCGRGQRLTQLTLVPVHICF